MAPTCGAVKTCLVTIVGCDGDYLRRNGISKWRRLIGRGRWHEKVGSRLFSEFDDVCAVVDSDGPERAEDVLTQEALELRANALREVTQVQTETGWEKRICPASSRCARKRNALAMMAGPLLTGSIRGAWTLS